MRRLGLAISVVTLLLVSCATRPLSSTTLDLFVVAPANDPWNAKVTDWQERHHLDQVTGSQPWATSDLGQRYADFTAEMESRRLEDRHALVRDTVDWVQGLSREYYRSDGKEDHWATLGHVIANGGDDCDGLDLLTFVLLRHLGFESDEIYRSIVVERRSGQHHMVTLWFEEGSRDDPFVLDPTGVVRKGLARLSSIRGWEPIELFDEDSHYRVEPRPGGVTVAGR